MGDSGRQVSPPIVQFDNQSVPGPVLGDGTRFPANMCGPGSKVNPSLPPKFDRCGYGPRLPMLLLSPWVRPNTVDSSVMSTDAILRFIEDRFLHGERIGDGSLDVFAGSLMNAFNAPRPNLKPLALNPSTGEPVRRRKG